MTNRSDISERDSRILADYEAQEEKNIPVLVTKYRLSNSQIRNILKSNGITPRSNGKRGPKTDKQITVEESDLLRIVANRVIRRIVDLEITHAEYAKRVDLDRATILAIKDGKTDVTLLQVLKLAMEEGKSFHEYVKPMGI